MNGKALIQTRPEGYVVVWFEDCTSTPLRNFGWWRSAAYDFREYINHTLAGSDKFERQIRGWADTYKPEDRYSYPEIREKGGVTLRKQKQ